MKRRKGVRSVGKHQKDNAIFSKFEEKSKKEYIIVNLQPE